MKKYILALALVLTAMVSMAQEFKEVDFRSSTNTTTTDTVTNAGVKLLVTPSTPQFYNTVGVGVVVTKISGTSAGVVRLMGSLDGINYFRVNPTDSLNVGNVTPAQSKAFIVTSYAYKYLGVQYTGTGTMAAKITSKALYKRGKQ